MKKFLISLSSIAFSAVSINTATEALMKTDSTPKTNKQIGKTSIELEYPSVPSELYYCIYLRNDTINELITQYETPGMDVISTISQYYQDIMQQFDISTFSKSWNKIDFQRSALVMYNSIGQINDYCNFYKPQIGIRLLIFKASSTHTSSILKEVTSQYNLLN